MRIKYCLLFSVLLTIFSCKQKNYDQKILGEWNLASTSFTEKGKETVDTFRMQHSLNVSGYLFVKNNVCINKAGYFDYKTKNEIWKPKTKYELIGNNLNIFDPSDRKWVNWKIVSLTDDTLVIKKNDNDTDNPVKYQYIKQHIAPLKADFADEIVLSAYSTWGINHDIIIKQNGAVLYRGFNSNNKLEYLTANISLDKFISIEQGFAKADFLRLKHDYSTNGADGSEVSISFVKDGKIIKSIHDYERSGPFELVWAYLPLEYLHEHLKFKPVDGKFLSPDVQLPFFEKGSDRGFINSSAGFYLLSLIRSGKLTNKKFHPEYRLKFYKSDNLLKMETDGQIYQANWEDGGQTSYDIGFNFINNNQDKIGFIKNLATGQIKFPPPLRKYSHPKKPNHQ